MDNVLRAVGVHQAPTGTYRFTVWAPSKNKVELIVDDQSPLSLERDEYGYWSTEIKSLKGTERYCYRIDGKDLPDPASRFQPDGVHKASCLIDTYFDWTDQNWNGIALQDMVIYELHVGTFTKEGTFAGVISKLDYLVELGVNAIEIMPVAQFPGSRNWGYDGVFPFAVQASYGGAVGFKKLINAAHTKGIAVILDVVYNHLGPEGNYFGEYGPYFTHKYKTFWGQAINYDDAWCDGVRNFFWQNALMWLDEFHVDGLRMDAVHAIWDFSALHFIEELTTRVNELEKRSGCKKILIAEIDLNNPRYISPKSRGGYGMQGQWIDEFHHALHSLVTGEKDGYYEDFGDAKHFAKALRDCYVYTGEYSVHRKRKFGVSPSENAYDQFIVFAQNHDQVGNRMLGDRLSTQISFEQQKLVACALLLAPQIPMLFMGEEYGETNPFQYFISHTDEALVKMVQDGRKKEFSYFGWTGEIPDPQAPSTFEQCILSWDYEGNADKKTLLAFYKYLITMRKNQPALREISRSSVYVFDPTGGKVVAYERVTESQRLVIILNFDNNIRTFELGHKSARKIFDSSDSSWRGPGQNVRRATSAEPVLLNPHCAVVFEVNE
jgi:maltooligosyltrehalose trehalohydrolase